MLAIAQQAVKILLDLIGALIAAGHDEKAIEDALIDAEFKIAQARAASRRRGA